MKNKPIECESCGKASQSISQFECADCRAMKRQREDAKARDKLARARELGTVGDELRAERMQLEAEVFAASVREAKGCPRT